MSDSTDKTHDVLSRLSARERAVWLEYLRNGFDQTLAYCAHHPKCQHDKAYASASKYFVRLKKKLARKRSCFKRTISVWIVAIERQICVSRLRRSSSTKAGLSWIRRNQAKFSFSRITELVCRGLSYSRRSINYATSRLVLIPVLALVFSSFAVANQNLSGKTLQENNNRLMISTNPDINVIWEPHEGSQELFLSCPVFECLYEGTRGPGKTDALLMDYAQDVGRGYGADWRGIVFRREYKELDDIVKKSKKWFRRIFPRARFLESKSDYKWKFPDGEELFFRAAKNIDDYWSYHGHEYPFLGWEELTNWPDLRLYLDMMSVCRSSNPNVPRKYRATANPYGPGHNSVKSRFIDPMPPGVIYKDPEGRERVRIHGSIYENKTLLAADPQYLENLKAIKDKNKRRAWLFGDWDIVAGGAIDDVWDRDIHEIAPFKIPSSWYVDRAFDWGSSKPFSVGWWAESDGTEATLADGRKKSWPRGTLFRIAEWYGWNGNPNEGVRMIDSNIGKGIRERETKLKEYHTGMRILPGPADSSIFDADPGKDSTAQGINAGYYGKSIHKNRDIFVHADKSPGSRKRRLESLRRHLNASLEKRMEDPGLFVFDTCRDGFLRTMPVLTRDRNDPDDVDTDAEDHVMDETGYRLTATKKIVRRVRVTGV